MGVGFKRCADCGEVPEVIFRCANCGLETVEESLLNITEGITLINCLATSLNEKIAYCGPEGRREIPVEQVYYTPDILAALENIVKLRGVPTSIQPDWTAIHSLIQKTKGKQDDNNPLV